MAVSLIERILVVVSLAPVDSMGMAVCVMGEGRRLATFDAQLMGHGRDEVCLSVAN